MNLYWSLKNIEISIQINLFKNKFAILLLLVSNKVQYQRDT